MLPRDAHPGATMPTLQVDPADLAQLLTKYAAQF